MTSLYVTFHLLFSFFQNYQFLQSFFLPVGGQIKSQIVVIVINTFVMLKLGRITSVNRICSALLLYFPFSQKLSKWAQRAIWDKAIVQTIRDSIPSQDQDAPSLHDKVLGIQLPQKAKKYEFDPQIRQEALKMFKEGIILNDKIFNQVRFRDGSQSLAAQSQAPFIFYPNYLNTQQIFKNLMFKERNKQILIRRLLINGGAGIGKSGAAIQLIAALENTHFYFYQVHKHKQQDKNNQLSKQLKQLQQEDLVFQSNLPRFIYWNFTQEKITKKYIQAIIVNQLSELSEQQKHQLLRIQKYSDFVKELCQFYPPQTNFVPFVDQINILVSMIRKVNDQTGRMMKKNLPNFSRPDQMEKHQNYAYFKLFSNFITLGHYVLNSPKAIETQMLYKAHQSTGILTLNLENHSPIPIFRVRFEQLLCTPFGAIDFWNIFWFQLKRRVLMFDKADFDLELMHQSFKKITKYKELPPFSTFLNVRNQIRKQLKNLQNVMIPKTIQKQQTNIENFESFLEKLINQFRKQCLLQSQAQFRKFYDKVNNNDLIKRLIQIIHLQCQKDLSSMQSIHKKDTLVQVKSNILEKDPQLKQINTPQQFFQTNIFKQNFACQIVDNSTFRLPWTVKQFYLLGASIFFKENSSFLPLSSNLIKALQNKSFKGLLLESCLFVALQGQSIFQFEPFQKNDSLKRILLLPIAEKTTFYSLNYRKPQSSNSSCLFYQNFEEVRKVCKNNPKQYVIAWPHKMKDGKFQHDYQHQVIDFIIASYSEEQLIIYSFDITATQFARKINDKITKAKNFLLPKFEQAGAIERMKLFHYIICPKSVNKERVFFQSENFFIATADLFLTKVIHRRSSNISKEAEIAEQHYYTQRVNYQTINDST